MRYWIFLVPFLFFCTLCAAQSKKCSVPKGTGGQYKILSEDYASSEPRELHLEVLIPPENFTKEYLTELRKRVKARYCYPEYIYVAIYDSEQLARRRDSFSLDRQRGLYVFDKPMRTDNIKFSSKPGIWNPPEIIIDFSKPLLD